MPRIGTPRSNSFGSQCGAPGSYTLIGPPERMIPFGFNSFTRAALRSWRTTWQKTFSSRTRRAMSCPNCEPKSKIRTSSFVMSEPRRMNHRVTEDTEPDKGREKPDAFQTLLIPLLPFSVPSVTLWLICFLGLPRPHLRRHPIQQGDG